MLRPGQTDINALEHAILEYIGRHNTSLSPLIEKLHVLSRKYTGVGSYTDFKPDVGHPDLAEGHIGLDAIIHIPGIPHGLTAVLFCKNGYPKSLEIVTYSGYWDGLIEGFSIEELS